jgi:type VI secretion system protein ImpK
MGLGRAWAVQQLLALAGIEIVKVPIASKGESEPIGDNATPEGRAANRRVTAEFLVE